MDVALWHRVDANGIATLMMSAINLQLMSQFRHEIRLFRGHQDYVYETYNKRIFIKRFGLSIYVTKENATYSIGQLLRTLFYKYPQLLCELEVVNCSTFTDDPPNFQPGKRSRIGDKIYLIDSPELADKLKNYPEEFKFYLSSGFSISIRGGIRGESQSTSFSNSFASKVMLNSSSEALRNAQNHERRP